MRILSQNDPSWNRITMGETKQTVGRVGCTITCISMASDWFKEFKTPGELAKLLSFTKPDPFLIWSSLEKNLNFKLKTRFYGWDNPEIQMGIRDDNKIALLEVNHTHWVLAIKTETLPWMKTHYVVIDPWDGKKKSTYKRWNITGGAILIKK